MQRAGLVLNVGLLAASVLLGLRLIADGSFWRADFVVFYTGGSMALEGRSDHLYDLDEQAACQGAGCPNAEASRAFYPSTIPPPRPSPDAAGPAPLADRLCPLGTGPASPCLGSCSAI